VLMPMHNAGLWVHEAVESIRRQSYGNFEFIIVDDGSTDDGAATVSRLAAEDSRMRLISLERTGLVNALNRGLQECRGEYIARMDADDVSLPERLELHVQYLLAHPECVALGCAHLLIDEDGAPISVLTYAPEHDEIHREHLAGSPGAISHACLIRRDALVALGGYPADVEYLEDYWLFLRLAEVGRLANLTRVLYKYRQHHRNVQFTQVERQQRCIDRIVAEARQRNGLPPLDARTWPRFPMPVPVDRHRSWSLWAAGAGNRGTALKHAMLALRHSPLSSRSWYVLVRSLLPAGIARLNRASDGAAATRWRGR
jgi:GT2 family glycosyltransferase